MLTQAKLFSLWEKFKEFPVAFDDFGRGSFEEFVNAFWAKDSIFYEIGDELGIACARGVRPRLDAVIHMVMFDRRLRGREPLFIEILKDLFDSMKLRRVTAGIPENRTITMRLLKRLGFSREGIIRQAFLTDGKYMDLHVFGILREEVL